MAEDIPVLRSMFIPADQVKEFSEDEPEVTFKIGNEDKAGKATAYHPELRCGICQFPMRAADYSDGRYYTHEVPSCLNTKAWHDCPNAGKRFKVDTVQLEEL